MSNPATCMEAKLQPGQFLATLGSLQVDYKRPGKAIYLERWRGGMIASPLMKEEIDEAKHLSRGSAKAQVFEKSSSILAGERTAAGGVLSRTRPQQQELCVLEEEAGAGKGCTLPGGSAESPTAVGFVCMHAASSDAWESIWH
jgi:hypothetical protein